MNRVLVSVDHQFERTPDGRVWVKTIYGYDFWKRYLSVFDKVRVVGRVKSVDHIEGRMLLSSGENVEFFDLPSYRGAKEFALSCHKICKSMKSVATECSCAIMRIPSPIAGVVLTRVKKSHIPWAVEVVNDPWDNFAPGTVKSLFRPLYRLLFTYQVKSMAAKANGASYVTELALQNRYPSFSRIHGKDKQHFESFYSSIILKSDYFWSEREYVSEKSQYTIVHVNSCVTDYSKGHDVVIRVCKLLRDRGLNVKVIFVGDGPMREHFEKMAKEYGVEEYVRFTGLLSEPSEVRRVLILGDILVFPTIGEGLPRTIIEAMAVGLPCISTPVAGIPELIPKEDMFDQQDASAIANRTFDILTNKEEYDLVSRRNLEKAREYEDSILKSRRDEFYKKLNTVSI